MKIKPSDRVIYAHNPLAEVLCQVRFDRILQLEANAPDAFQEKFAAEKYPKVAKEQVAAFQMSVKDKESIAVSSPSDLPTIHHFISVDGQRKVSVNADSLTFTCTTYERWEIFKRHFLEALEAFSTIYPHATAIRVGLRYKDLIERERLGLEGVPWHELLAPFVSGVFAADDFFETPLTDDGTVVQQASQTLLKLTDCSLLLQSALLRSIDNSGQQAFLIDSDFFEDFSSFKVDLERISSALDVLHTSADAVFRRCIKDRLHDALKSRAA